MIKKTPVPFAQENESNSDLDWLEKRVEAMEGSSEKLEGYLRGLEEKVQPVNAHISQLRNELNACVHYMVAEITPKLEAVSGRDASKSPSDQSLKSVQEFQEKAASLEASLNALQEKVLQEQSQTAEKFSARLEQQAILLKVMEERLRLFDGALKKEFQTAEEEKSGSLSEENQKKVEELTARSLALESQVRGFEFRFIAVEKAADQSSSELRGSVNELKSHFLTADSSGKDSQGEIKRVEESFLRMQDALRADFESHKNLMTAALEEMKASVPPKKTGASSVLVSVLQKLADRIESLEEDSAKNIQAGNERFWKMEKTIKAGFRKAAGDMDARFQGLLSRREVQEKWGFAARFLSAEFLALTAVLTLMGVLGFLISHQG